MLSKMCLGATFPGLNFTYLDFSYARTTITPVVLHRSVSFHPLLGALLWGTTEHGLALSPLSTHPGIPRLQGSQRAEADPGDPRGRKGAWREGCGRGGDGAARRLMRIDLRSGSARGHHCWRAGRPHISAAGTAPRNGCGHIRLPGLGRATPAGGTSWLLQGGRCAAGTHPTDRAQPHLRLSCLQASESSVRTAPLSQARSGNRPPPTPLPPPPGLSVSFASVRQRSGTLKPSLAWNLQQSSCLSLLSAGMTNVSYHWFAPPLP